MKKECINCKNFTLFYTKIAFAYYESTCGRCWANRVIVNIQERCDKWELKTVKDENEQANIVKALDNAVSQISAIKETLTKNDT